MMVALHGVITGVLAAGAAIFILSKLDNPFLAFSVFFLIVTLGYLHATLIGIIR